MMELATNTDIVNIRGTALATIDASILKYILCPASLLLLFQRAHQGGLSPLAVSHIREARTVLAVKSKICQITMTLV